MRARDQLFAGTDWHRSERIRSSPSAPFRRSTSVVAMRSSSCAQTALEQVTVRLPRASAVGVATAASASPTTPSQTFCTDARVEAGAIRSAPVPPVGGPRCHHPDPQEPDASWQM